MRRSRRASAATGTEVEPAASVLDAPATDAEHSVGKSNDKRDRPEAVAIDDPSAATTGSVRQVEENPSEGAVQLADRLLASSHTRGQLQPYTHESC
jgi:hypothetical protein